MKEMEEQEKKSGGGGGGSGGGGGGGGEGKQHSCSSYGFFVCLTRYNDSDVPTRYLSDCWRVPLFGF